MVYKTRPAKEDDLPAIARLSHEAFQNHEWTRAMYPEPDREGNIQRYLNRHTKAWKAGQSQFYVAVDTDPSTPSHTSAADRVLGYARWEVTREQQPEGEWNLPYEAVAVPVPPSANADANEQMARALHNMRLKHYHGNPMVLLNFIAVEPGYQRYGLGHDLMQWGIQEADRLGLPCWLESTNAGLRLYKSVGYEVVDIISEDLTKYGVQEPCVITIMKRPARSSTEETASS